MTQDQFDILKEEFTNNIKEYVVQNGGIFPHITIFADGKNPENEEENKPALIHIPIPDEMMMDDEGKDKFVNEVFPEIAKKVKTKFTPNALAWTSEAWVRTIHKKDNPNINYHTSDWKELPIEKEVIIITIESENDKKCVIYDVKRNGKQITHEGDIVDKVELTEATDLAYPDGIGGRFSGLFAKLKD